VTVSTTIPAPVQETAAAPVRFAALRGKVPLPWVTVAVLAVVLAAADVFILVALQGAVGAIERSQSPFVSWLRYVAMLTPVFAVAVVLAFGRAYRTGRRTLGTALLVVLAATAVAIIVLLLSTAYDYHLQSALLARMQVTHGHSTGVNGTASSVYGDGGWTPEQRDTMLVDVKAFGYGSVLIAGVNVVLVGWIAALGGGRLHRFAGRR
jgi:hypothetical protein